jgi:hypothetical protein
MDKIYEDGSLGGIRDNTNASRFKQRRESQIENWENSVESQRKALEQEKQKLYFAQAEVIDNRLDSLLKIKNNVHIIQGNSHREENIDRVVDILELLEPLVDSMRKDLANKKKMLTQEQIDQIECNYSNGKLEQAPDWNIINRERKD